jgi:hypothetical protein
MFYDAADNSDCRINTSVGYGDVSVWFSYFYLLYLVYVYDAADNSDCRINTSVGYGDVSIYFSLYICCTEGWKLDSARQRDVLFVSLTISIIMIWFEVSLVLVPECLQS